MGEEAGGGWRFEFEGGRGWCGRCGVVLEVRRDRPSGLGRCREGASGAAPRGLPPAGGRCPPAAGRAVMLGGRGEYGAGWGWGRRRFGLSVFPPEITWLGFLTVEEGLALVSCDCCDGE